MTAHLRSEDLVPLTGFQAAAPAPANTGHNVARVGLTRSRSARLYRRHGKRALDILIVLVTLPVTLPIILLMAVLVSLDGGRPFYSQERVGLSGRVFRMWKLRSMHVDADAALERHLACDPDLRAEWDINQKLRNDPRVTSIGEFLRRSSIDELPQIFNVLRGEMSIVGPRPMMVGQQALYPGRAYYALRPGLTGVWQVTARNNSVFAFRAACDALYDRKVSLGLDLRIILSTVAVVLRCTGR